MLSFVKLQLYCMSVKCLFLYNVASLPFAFETDYTAMSCAEEGKDFTLGVNKFWECTDNVEAW